MFLRNLQMGYRCGCIAALSTALCAAMPISASPLSDIESLEIAQIAFDDLDYDTAFELWTPLADSGNTDAQLALADAALNCNCVDDGTNMAFKYYRMAAKEGNVYALRQMGRIYNVKGDDNDEAAVYYQAAADMGDVESQIELGDLYRDGVGGEETEKLSPKYYLMAAAQGDGRAYARMARIYGTGGPIAADPTKAYVAQSIAAALSFPMAKEKLPEAAKKLNAKQLKAAKALVAKCVKANYLKCL